MNIESTPTESWGQPPISVYKMDSDGENLYATELDDYYGELACSNYTISDMAYLAQEDMEDIALFQQSLDEPTVTWKDLKQELTRDGLL